VGTTCAFPGLSARIEIVGRDGSAVIDNDQLVHCKFRDQYENGEVGHFGGAHEEKESGAQDDTGSTDPTAIATQGHARQFIDMIEAIEEDREPKMNGDTAQKPLEIILAVYESARTGRPVKLSE
jgi:predicted dehydrogenase